MCSSLIEELPIKHRFISEFEQYIIIVLLKVFLMLRLEVARPIA